ncbi:uncharacterized protein J7T54_008395 [Emericellopsis cladophorae]|uniref:Uncharacterized protein n=1 Tax=Emericellopsis cladophorae TaxID=2686198 RepID=A0A9P9Y3L7_9HYPO|nr:uncharacterized protein J7T54_008395 [Emericellopsis cladophorae]KAI6782309.1 hypothetical protein J7T54_008395 [Emericellopsis cladophorae]
MHSTILSRHLDTKGPILESEHFNTLNKAILSHTHNASAPYVRHVVLSFSALHLASQQATHTTSDPSGLLLPRRNSGSPSEGSWLHTALSHNAQALALFLPAIQAGITPTTAEPLLAASVVLVACQLALPAADPTRRTAFDRIDLLAQVAGLFQGANHIFLYNGHTAMTTRVKSESPTSSGKSSSSLSECSSSPSTANGVPKSPGDDVPWAEAEASVHCCIGAMNALPPASTDTERTRRIVLHHAAAKLIRTFSLISTSQRNFHVLCVWFAMVKKEFVGLLAARDPFALILLAHWSVCKTNMDGIWWARGWPEAAVSSIDEALGQDSEYRGLLAWCVRQAHTGQEIVPSAVTAHTLQGP